jgi:two-component system response regulator FixJ
MEKKIQLAFIDDDATARDSMSSLLEAAGYGLRTYASARLFLDQLNPETACVIADIYMPEMGGLELQKALVLRNVKLPIIFVTGDGDVPLAVRALRAGATDFIEKPFTSKTMLDSISRALSISRQSSSDFVKVSGAKMMLARLTPREQNVMKLLVSGRSTKIAAHELGISPRTVETHRARIMEKMSARNIADVVRVAMMAA